MVLEPVEASMEPTRMNEHNSDKTTHLVLGGVVSPARLCFLLLLTLVFVRIYNLAINPGPVTVGICVVADVGILGCLGGFNPP